MINFVIVDDNSLQRKNISKIVFSQMMNNKLMYMNLKITIIN